MYKRLLAVLVVTLLCSTVTANAAVSRKAAGPPPDCHRFPHQPRCN